MDLDPTSGAKGGAHEGVGRTPYLMGPPKLHQRTSCTHIYLRTQKLPEQNLDWDFRRRKTP